MVRVLGSSGDSGFHCESQEEVKVKIEQGDQASSDLESTTTPLNEARFADRQSARRTSVDGNEADPNPDLEDKLQLPPQVPSGTPVGLESHRDSLTKQTKAGSDRYTFADSPITRKPYRPLGSRYDRIQMKTSTMRKKMKVSELDEVDLGRPDPEWSEAALEYAFRLKELHEFLDQDPVMQILRLEQIGERKGPVAAPVMTDNKLDAVKDFMGLLKVTGLIVGAFDVNDLFDLDVKIIQSSHRMFFDKLKVLVGETTTNPGPVVLDSVSPLLIGPTGGWTSSSSIGVVDPGSDAPPEPPRTALGPSGPTAIAPDFDAVTGRLESHFQGATSRFLKENEAFIPAPVAEVSQNPGSQDVEVESAGSQDHSHWDNDPDDIDFQPSAPPALATATAISAESRAIQRFQISAISELKEFSGKVPDEDRARTWISKVKSSFRRDHVSDEEKCLTLAELLSGPAKNWHRQLPRTTRNKWSDLLRSFRIQYCGFGVSGVHQYYQAHKRPDESALEYLYRLNVAGLRARLKIKDGGSKERREHVVHFIDTSGDEDLADQLTLLRLPDVDELEAGLRALDRAKNRRKTSALESDNCPLKGLPTPPQAPAVYVRAIKIQATGSEYDSEGDGSVFDEDYPRRVYLAAGNKR